MFKDNKLLTLFPSFVGSKRIWIKYLLKYKGMDFIEPFCGSAVVSFNLAKSCILNDLDPYIYKIINEFDTQIIPDVFTKDDYLSVRTKNDWWRYVFCLQAMSFSGVFRYSKNGYNVPVKKNMYSVSLKERFKLSLNRWEKLHIEIHNDTYASLSLDKFIDKVVILDPPYQGSKASYNNKSFNYDEYWEWATKLLPICKVLIMFDRIKNLEDRNIPIYKTRKMRVNGKYDGDIEAMSIYENGGWLYDC